MAPSCIFLISLASQHAAYAFLAIFGSPMVQAKVVLESLHQKE
jgi:hypothetical protein